MNKNEVFEKTLVIWGWEHQSNQLMNAMADLTKKITQIHIDIFFKRPSTFDEMVKALAMVQLKIDHLKYELTENEMHIHQKEYNQGLEDTKKLLRGVS